MLTFANGYSPLLSVLTAVFEVGVALWALSGPGRTAFLRPVAGICLLLAAYQVIEVVVCHDPTVLGWARLGFITVLGLPPTGLLLMSRYQPDSTLGRRGAQLSWIVAAALAVWVAVDDTFLTGTVCQAVFATYLHEGSSPSPLYGALYTLGCLVLVTWGTWQAANLPDPVLRKHAAELSLGNAAFMLLALLTQVAVPSIDLSQPSLMCHYALLLAMLLASTVRRERALALGG